MNAIPGLFLGFLDGHRVSRSTLPGFFEEPQRLLVELAGIGIAAARLAAFVRDKPATLVGLYEPPSFDQRDGGKPDHALIPRHIGRRRIAALMLSERGDL